MHIEYVHEFIVLSETLNFTSAAEELHLTQSALSKHIASLEKDLGVKLLDRNQHVTRLTDQGRRFAESGRLIWEVYSTAKNAFYEESRNEYRLLVGGLIDNPGGFALMSRVAERMKAIDERFSVNLVPATTTSVSEQVMSDTIDCALSFYSKEDFGKSENSEIEFVRVCKLPFMAVMLENHPLASKENLCLNDLEGQTLLHVVGPRFNSGWRHITRVLDRNNITAIPKTSAAISSYDYVGINMEGLLFIVPQIELRHKELQDSSRRVIRIGDEDAYFPYTVVYKKSNESIAMKTFIFMLSAVIQEEISQIETEEESQGRWLRGELA